MGGETDTNTNAVNATANDAAAAAAAAPAALDVSDQSVQINLISEYEKYANSTDIAHVCASIVAPVFEEEKEKAPVDAIIVQDISGSMSGTKIELSRETIKFVINNLGPKDRLSLVLYDTNVSVAFPLTYMTGAGRDKALTLVQKLVQPGSSTNLSGGVLKGMELMNERKDAENRVASVMLFTDGLANVGIRSSDALATAVNNMLDQTPNKYTVYTFGVGEDHNAQMLRDVSEAGNGMYYYLKTAEDIPESFADCLGGLMSLVAQNIKMTFTINQDTTARFKAVHSNKKATISADGKRAEIAIADLQSEEKKEVLCEIHLPNAEQQAEPLTIKTECSYFNVVTNIPETREASLELTRCQEPAEQGEPNVLVQQQKLRFITVKAMEHALQEAAAHHFEQAQASLLKAEKELEFMVARKDKYALELLDDIKQCQTSLKERETNRNYMQSLHSCQQTHFNQRSNVSSHMRGYVSYETNCKAAFKARAKF